MVDVPLGESAVCGTCGTPYLVRDGHACSGPRSSAVWPVVDLDAAEARALAAPAGRCEAFAASLWIGWSAPGDDENDGQWWDSGRHITVQENGWHIGSEDPGPELWNLFANARADVLALVAEVRWLRSALAEALVSPPVREAA